MVKKLKILVWLVCISVLLPCRSIYGETSDNAAQGADSSKVLAGVSVEYAGEIEFLVLDRDTDRPIQGASVEIYIPSENRYVLFGVTDENGRFKVDAVSGAAVKYRVYKSDWKPYPQEGTVQAQHPENKQTVTVYLYRKKSGGGTGGNGGGGNTSIESPVITVGKETGQSEESGEITEATGSNISGIPKTGVEGAAGYWLAALVFFLIAGLILIYLLKLENDTEDKKYGR